MSKIKIHFDILNFVIFFQCEHIIGKYIINMILVGFILEGTKILVTNGLIMYTYT